MTQVILPYRPVAGDPEDISQVMADFDAMLNVLNGDIKNDNLAAVAAIVVAKLAAGSDGDRLETVGSTPTWVRQAKARVVRAAGMTLAHATWTPIQFSTEQWDNDNMVDLVSFPTRLTAHTAGLYSMAGSVQFPPAIAGPRIAAFRINGATIYSISEASMVPGPDNTAVVTSDLLNLQVGHYVELIGYMVSGGNPLPGVTGTLSVARIGA